VFDAPARRVSTSSFRCAHRRLGVSRAVRSRGRARPSAADQRRCSPTGGLIARPRLIGGRVGATVARAQLWAGPGWRISSVVFVVMCSNRPAWIRVRPLGPRLVQLVGWVHYPYCGLDNGSGTDTGLTSIFRATCSGCSACWAACWVDCAGWAWQVGRCRSGAGFPRPVGSSGRVAGALLFRGRRPEVVAILGISRWPSARWRRCVSGFGGRRG
jgi:hypothetical protein